MGNGKWENGEMGSTLHFTQQKAADVLWLQPSNVMKSMSIHSLRDHLAWQLAPKGYATALHYGLSKLVLCSMFFTFGSFLAFLKFVESVIPTLYKESFWGFFMQLLAQFVMICLTFSTIILKQHVLFKLYKFTKCQSAVIPQWIHTGSIENIIAVCEL